MNDLDALARLIQAIELWRAHLVLVGGWAHRLYRLHNLARVPGYQPVTTLDTDLAFSNDAPLEGDIRAALEQAGFSEELTGTHEPPASHYLLGESDAGFYAEFLTPLVGSGLKRDGKPDATIAKAGITAQKLRYLDILLMEPWVITVGKDQSIPLPNPTDLQVTNPTSFLAQKLLIRQYRPNTKRAQDILYIHDTLELFIERLDDLRATWEQSIRPSIKHPTARRLTESIAESFSTVTDSIRDAARIPQDREISPDRLQALCRSALNEIFR